MFDSWTNRQHYCQLQVLNWRKYQNIRSNNEKHLTMKQKIKAAASHLRLIQNSLALVSFVFHLLKDMWKDLKKSHLIGQLSEILNVKLKLKWIFLISMNVFAILQWINAYKSNYSRCSKSWNIYLWTETISLNTALPSGFFSLSFSKAKDELDVNLRQVACWGHEFVHSVLLKSFNFDLSY